MVRVDTLERTIEEHPFFQGIDAPLRALLVGCAANERFEAGGFLFREGGAADKFYLIRSGCVAIELNAPGRPPLVVETVDDGQILGWSWLVAPYRWSFDARATALTRAVSFDGKCLRGKMEADHRLGYELLRRFVPVMGDRLAAARLQMLDLYGPDGKGKA